MSLRAHKHTGSCVNAASAVRMKATDRSLKTWTPAVQRRAPDNIVSSNYMTTKVFVPSYEKEVRPRIEQLLTNDYQRIWWKEKRIWDETIAGKTAAKRILPRMLIKRKVPICVTVKYQTQIDRWMGRKKQDSKCNLKKKESSKNMEELKSAENNNSTKLEKCEETKSEKCEEMKSEKCEEMKSEKCKETKSEKCDETKSEEHKEILSENDKENEDEREKENTGESRTD